MRSSPANGVEAPRFDAAVEDEREQDLEGLGLAGSVGSPQNQSTVGERELLVSVIPEVDDSSPSRSEAGRCSYVLYL